jgi:hypothetical protein
MPDTKKNHQVPVCPTCGEPVRFDFVYSKTSDKVKAILVLSLVGYFVLSLLLLGLSLPLEMRRHQTAASYDAWLQPLSKEPLFQLVIGIGLVSGFLIFYLDWFHTLYENRQKKRKASMQDRGEGFKYTCRSCGRQWN